MHGTHTRTHALRMHGTHTAHTRTHARHTHTYPCTPYARHTHVPMPSVCTAHALRMHGTCTACARHIHTPRPPGGRAAAPRLAAAALPLSGGDGHRQPAAGLWPAAGGCGGGGDHLHDGPGLRRTLRLAAAGREAAHAGSVHMHARTHKHTQTLAHRHKRTRTSSSAISSTSRTTCSYHVQATRASCWSSPPTCSAACRGVSWQPRAGS